MNPTVLDQIVRQQEEIESLRQQLAAALAACKVKDEAMHNALYSGSPYTTAFENALAVQPDDSALKAWLGEPVALLPIGTGVPPSIRSTCGVNCVSEKTALEYDPASILKLYTPKGLK